MGIQNIANTGMQAAMSDMEIIGNNISNSNTYGFKKSFGNFADLYPAGNAATGTQPGLGVNLLNIKQDFSSGGLQNTGRGSDLSINNDGFFILKDPTTGNSTYSRAGRFDVDNQGYLTLGSRRVQGFPSINGKIVAPSLVDLQIPPTPMQAKATTSMLGSLNLDANSQVPLNTTFSNSDVNSYNFSTNTTVYDSLGNPNQLTLYYIKTSTANT